jgi:hypothetical protein|tara:strand:- start:59 stop:427 length:369 start_codon:yes stop_codon:yes gene_type:complete
VLSRDGTLITIIVWDRLLELNVSEFKSAVSIDHSLALFASVFDLSGDLLLCKVLDDNFIIAFANLEAGVEVFMTFHTIGEEGDAFWGVVMSVGIGGSQEHGNSKSSFVHIFYYYINYTIEKK